MRGVILSAALVGLGVAGGYLLGAQRAQPSAPAVSERADRGDRGDRAPIVVADRGLTEADLRRVVQEEIAAGLPRQGSASAREAEPARPASPAVLDEGMRRIGQAMARRQWTRDDATALGRTLEAASPDQRAQILRTLIPALNRGEIKLTYRGDLF